MVKRKSLLRIDRLSVGTVSTLNVGHSIVEQAKKRNYVWGKEVEKRLANVIDVVAADVIYHKHCFVNFFKSTSSGNLKRGRPQNESIMIVMDKIYSILENSEECQFSIENDILSCIDYEYVPDVKTIRAKLLEKYGENIVISSANKKTTTVCFRGTSQNILTRHWYENRKVNKEEETKNR